MTPSIDLRANALQQVTDAETLLKSGSHKNACSQAALGVEMMLKARLCRIMNWSHYPGSRSEAQAVTAAAGLSRNTRLLTHDLDELMILNEENSIFTRDYLNVAWPKVGGWGIEHRYSPNTIISEQEAGARVGESAVVVRQLYRYECCQALLEFESIFVERFGLVCLLAVLKEADDSYVLTISPLIKNEHVNNALIWVEKYINKLDPDLKIYSRWRLVHPNSEIAIVCARQLEFAPSGALAYVSGNVVGDYKYIAEGLVVSATRWTMEQVEESWENATEVGSAQTTE